MPDFPRTRLPRPCIGVFDSGFGGLTVLRALLQQLPAAEYLYLGDSARLPYGSKSAETVTRYTEAAIRHLCGRGAELIVIACNTASALALPHILPSAPVPLVGVIEPGAQAAAQSLAAGGKQLLVLATEATVASHAYAKACRERDLHATEKACPLLVPLVESGWTDHSVTAEVIDIYLREAVADTKPDAVLLGCTHYPLLRPLLTQCVRHRIGPVPVVDSAEATAHHVKSLLPQAALQDGVPGVQCFATDSVTKFQELGSRFLGRAIHSALHIDLEP